MAQAFSRGIAEGPTRSDGFLFPCHPEPSCEVKDLACIPMHVMLRSFPSLLRSFPSLSS